MKISFVGAFALTASICSTSALAGVTLTTGSGSAVTTVQASANFESQDALFGQPYVEDGLSFTRTNLSFDNNSCGYAGCSGATGFSGFSGNYMYGKGSGYFDIRTESGQTFTALEFVLGSGYGSSIASISWQAFLNGDLVGSGTGNYDVGTVMGFSGGVFDDLRYTDTASFHAPAFDTVKAQFSASAVPEPASWAMMVGGFGLLGGALRRKKASVSFA